jgi:hypothetical protein
MQHDRSARILWIFSVAVAACTGSAKAPEDSATGSGTGGGSSMPLPRMEMQTGAGGMQTMMSMPRTDASTVQTGGPADAGVDSGRASPHDASTTDGGTDAGGQNVTDPLCANRAGHCVKVCEGGACDCHCDCRSDAECGITSTPNVCVAAGDPIPPCCGTGPQCGPTRSCSGLGADLICSSGPCASCVPPCTSDDYCGQGYRCGSDKLCVYKRCDGDGFACPARSHCEATDANADVHGCLHDGCSSDEDCAPGACVNGRCHDAPGSCQPTLCA